MSKKLIKISILMLLTVSLLATNVLAATLTTGGATVDADALNLRSEANTSSEIKAVMSDGTFLLVTGTMDGWYKVIYNGVEASSPPTSWTTPTLWTASTPPRALSAA